jgi:hypothetical protein
MYFTDPGDNAIGRVSVASGEVTEYPIPATSLVSPSDITVAGGEIVFDESEVLGEGQEVGVLGSVTPNTTPGDAPLTTPPSISQLTVALRAQLARVTAEARPALRRRRRGFAVTVVPPEAGTLTLLWTADVPATTHGRAPKSVTLATGREAFALATPASVSVTPTAAGRRLLRRSARRSRLRLTLHADFAGLWAGPVEASVRQGT